jgi:hypothetical protein
MASYFDDESIPYEVDSSEGEEWGDSNVLVPKLMEIDSEQVPFFYFSK